MPEEIEIGILHRHAFANPNSLPDSRRVAQIVERHLQNLFDFVRRGDEIGTLFRDANNRVQRLDT